jgi:transcriptional regulator with XRE-family HTH domain
MRIEDVPSIGPRSTFSSRLTKALKHRGVSAAQLARETQMTRSAISQWMHDPPDNPSALMIMRVADTLHIPYSWLLVGDVTKNKETHPMRRNKHHELLGRLIHAYQQLPEAERLRVTAQLEQQVEKMKKANGERARAKRRDEPYGD